MHIHSNSSYKTAYSATAYVVKYSNEGPRSVLSSPPPLDVHSNRHICDALADHARRRTSATKHRPVAFRKQARPIRLQVRQLRVVAQLPRRDGRARQNLERAFPVRRVYVGHE